METAKVDIRKLQLLNDRISQCFEALNQVRLSVHGVQGLSHSNPPMPPMDPRTAGVPAGYAGIPNQVFGIGYPQASPYPQQVSPFGAQSPYVPGISHTSGLPLPGVVPNPIGAWDPRLDPRLAAAATGQLQAGQVGYPGVGIGLSHSSTEAVDPLGRTWNDPILTARVVQTFPYATFAFLPISSI